MRKSVILICAFLSIITSNIHANPYNLGCDEGDWCTRFRTNHGGINKEYLVGRKERYISLIAARQAVLNLKDNYTPTNATDFLPITNYIYEKSGITSPYDILIHCLEHYSYHEYMIYECLKFKDGKCITKGLSYMTRCFAFLDKVLRFHNDAVSKNIVSNTGGVAGTYVKRTNAADVLKVIDVISAGQDNGPTPVWLVEDNESNIPKQFMYKGKPLLTRTADMFLDKPSGVPMGAFDNNYIILRDVTDMIINLYRSGIGTDSYTINHGVNLRPGGKEDLKRNKDFNMSEYINKVIADVPEINEVDSHTNGVLFEGQVVTAEWLGHYLYGMVRQESSLNSQTIDDIRDGLQKRDNGGKDGQSDVEAPQFRVAADDGSEFVRFLSHFSKSSFSSPQDAMTALVQFLQTQHRWENVRCKKPEKTTVITNDMTSGMSLSGVMPLSGNYSQQPVMRDIYTIKCTLDDIEYTFGIGDIEGM